MISSRFSETGGQALQVYLQSPAKVFFTEKRRRTEGAAAFRRESCCPSGALSSGIPTPLSERKAHTLLFAAGSRPDGVPGKIRSRDPGMAWESTRMGTAQLPAGGASGGQAMPSRPGMYASPDNRDGLGAVLQKALSRIMAAKTRPGFR